MAIKLSGSTIIDDSRNIVNAGIATFTDSVYVGTGSSEINSSLYVNANLEVTGLSTFSSGFDVSGVTSFTAPSQFYSAVSISTTLSVSGNSTFESGANITGNLGVTGSGSFTGPVSVNSISAPGNNTLGTINVTTLNVDTATFDSFNLVGGGTTSFTFSTQNSNEISVGSTIIPVKTYTGVEVGDFVSIGTFFSKKSVNGLIGSTSVVPYNENIATRSISYDVGAGTTVIFLNSNANISVGNSISITGIASYIPVVGVATTAVGVVNVDNVFPTISGNVSIGSTIVGLSTLSGIAIGHSFSNSSGVREYIPIVGFGTTTIAPYNIVTITSSVYEELSANAEFIPLNATGLSNTVSIGNSITISDSGIDYIINAPVIGIGNTSVTPYTESLVNTTVSDTIGIGISIIPVNSTAQITAGVNKATISAEVGSTVYINEANVVAVGTTNITPYTQSILTTATNHRVVGIGETVIFVESTTGVFAGNRITVQNVTDTFITYLSDVTLVSVGATFVTIAALDAPLQEIPIGEEVGFSTVITTSPSITLDTTTSSIVDTNSIVAISTVISSREAIQISSGFAHTDIIPSGTAVSISTIRTDSPAIVLEFGVGYALTTGNTAIISYPTFPVSDAVLIGSGNTQPTSISAGTAATISAYVTSTEAVTVSSDVTESIPTYQDVLFERIDLDQSSINAFNVSTKNLDSVSADFERINIVGIATINGIKFPFNDGLKGQTLVTDGEGNLGFGTGGGSGGSEVILTVSTNTGNDNNDGKILPLKTIKKATQLASKVGRPVTIKVETGEYVEDNPIIVYDDVSIIGDSLRNIVVRPLNSSKDLFKVRNGCYLTGMSFNDYVDSEGVPQHTYDYSVAFDNPFDPQVDRTGYASTSILTITDVKYNHITGITSITTSTPHELYKGNTVRLSGIAFTCGYDEIGISTFVYDNDTGISTITFFSDALLSESGSGYSQKGYKVGDKLFLNNLPFTCSEEHIGVTTTIFPYPGLDPVYGAVYPITGINTTEKTVTIAGAASTIPHIYQGYPSIGISTFSYDNASGIATATTLTPHGFASNDKVAFEGLNFSCSSEHIGVTTTIFPDGTITDYTSDGYTFTVGQVIDSTTFTYNVGISTIPHAYVSGGTVKKVPTVQEVWIYPERNSDGRIDFGVVSVSSPTQFIIRAEPIPSIPHYYTQGGTARFSRPLINKSPYIQNCSILSSLGGNGILVDGNLVTEPNVGLIPELGEIPVVGDQPVFGKSMVAATFTMVSFGGIGWRTVNDGYAQVVSCFQIFCGNASLCQSGGYLSITNSATNFGNFALRSTGFSPKSFAFDRSRVVATGTQGGLQTLRVVGLGRSDQELYVLRFFDNNNVDRTSDFKPLVISQEFNGGQVDPVTDIFTIPAHPFNNGDSVVYFATEGAEPRQNIDGLISGNLYYVSYIDSSNFKLFEDDGLQTAASIGSTFVGINTFTKNNQEFFVKEMIDAHQSYQTVSLASTTSILRFDPGKAVTQTVTGGTATGYAVTFNNTTRQLLLSVEAPGGVRNFFNSAGGNISDHSPSPVSIGITETVNTPGYYTLEFTLDSTVPGNSIVNIANLPENYKCHFHRPSIVNSSSHTWEYSGSGIDYNALPENGGKTKPETEQVSELGGRVFASGTNELGDFKIGDQITAFNRTGNIIFNNKVSIGQLDSIRLSLSGGVAVEEFSTDTNLGESEVGGPSNTRVSTQLAVRSFLNNRLGTFIDKSVSTNAIPNAVVQLNNSGQINADLIPPKVVNFTRTNANNGRFYLSNQIPAVNVLQGDTVVEPGDSYVLINDVVSQYLVLDNGNQSFTFDNGDSIVSALSASVTGIVTAPPTGLVVGSGSTANYVGYGTTGLVKGVSLGLTLSSSGSGYQTVGVYTGVYLDSITGIGTSAIATITVGAAGSVTNVNLLGGGKGYQVGDTLTVSNPAHIGGRSGGSNFIVTVNDVETRLYVGLTNNQKFAGSSVLSDYIADDNAVAISTSLSANYTKSFNPSDVSVGGDIDFANDRIIFGSNNFANGDVVIYDANGGTMITAGGLGIFDNGSYYVKIVGAGSSGELYRNYNLTDKIDFTGSGTGTHILRRNVVNTDKNTVHFVNHGFTTGTPIRASGDTPTGISTNAFYYLGSVNTNNFTLHNTQSDALFSVNGVTFNPVAIAATHTGTFTITEQNVKYSDTVNTSSSDENNWTILATGTVSAENIVSGIIAPSRLGSGTANSDTFLNGVSQYEKIVKSVGAASSEPLTIIASSAEYAPGGIGTNKFYGNVDIRVNRVEGTLDNFSTLGAAKFKTSTFSIGDDGAVSLKNSESGDIDAATLGAQSPSYYLNSVNHTGSVPVTRGGTGLTGVPSSGALLVGSGSGFNLTTNPSLTGTLTAATVYWGSSASRTETKNNAGSQASKSGFFETSTPTNYPEATNWHHLIEARHSNDSNNYALQIAGSFFNQNLYFRKTNNSPTTAWSRVIAENSSGITTVGKIGVQTSVIPSGFDIAVRGSIGEFYNGQFWNVVTQADVGYGATQVPLNQYLGQLAFLDDYAPNALRRENGGTDDLIVDANGNIGIGTNVANYRLQVVGSFAATTKSFVIPHPTKPNKQLRYASLEGPENGVYIRGRTQDGLIELPDYWTELVDEDSITVNLTPIGDSATPRVKEILNNTVVVFTKEEGDLDYYYTVFAERKDVDKLEVEI